MNIVFNPEVFINIKWYKKMCSINIFRRSKKVSVYTVDLINNDTYDDKYLGVLYYMLRSPKRTYRLNYFIGVGSKLKVGEGAD